MERKYNIAVVGATGCVGKQVLDSLAERKFPVKQIKAIASSGSVGKEVSYGDEKLSIISLESSEAMQDNDIAFFCTSNEVSSKYIPISTKQGTICIDKSSFYRLASDVPLIIPEVNNNLITEYKNKNIIASPNCCVIPLAMVLHPLHKTLKIKRIVVSTYQSVSGAGKDAIDELEQQTQSIINSNEIIQRVFPRQIAFNIIPQIGPYIDNYETDEEDKIKLEIEKIFNNEIKISVTSVRVPVFIGHSMTVNIEFTDKISVDKAKEILSQAEFLLLSKDKEYLTPIEVAGKDFVHVSRVRLDNSRPNTINLWISADNLRKGAGLNAVHIAERVIQCI